MKGRVVITVPDQGPPDVKSQFDVQTTLLLMAQIGLTLVMQSIPPPAPPVAVAEPTEAERAELRKILVG